MGGDPPKKRVNGKRAPQDCAGPGGGLHKLTTSYVPQAGVSGEETQAVEEFVEEEGEEEDVEAAELDQEVIQMRRKWKSLRSQHRSQRQNERPQASSSRKAKLQSQSLPQRREKMNRLKSQRSLRNLRTRQRQGTKGGHTTNTGGA